MSHLIWHPRHEVCSCPQPTPTASLSVSVPLPGRKICSIVLTPWHLCLLSSTKPFAGYRCSMGQLLPCVIQGALVKPPAFTRALGGGSQECWGGCSSGSSLGAQQSGMFSKACRDTQSICFLPPGLWSWRFPGLAALISSLFNSFWWFYFPNISPVALCEPLPPPPALCSEGWDIPWNSAATFLSFLTDNIFRSLGSCLMTNHDKFFFIPVSQAIHAFAKLFYLLFYLLIFSSISRLRNPIQFSYRSCSVLLNFQPFFI